MPDLIGQQIGQYQIVALLGRGGMAEVYRARQTLAEGVSRDVALKLIDARLAAAPEFIARFKREAQTLVSLSHPHILKAFDFGQYQDTVYLVMELLTGGSLAELIREGPLPLDTILRVLDHTAQALDYAHGKALVHRDLKPQNVLLDESGNAFLTDFGIVKLLNQGTVLTQSQMAVGTPAYMAPEQWTGEVIDARADLYSFGVMLFEMLTGRVPFRGDTPHRVMFQHISEPPPSVHRLRSDIPPDVDRMIATALSKDPAQRYSTGMALTAAFKASLGGQAKAAAVRPASEAIPPLRPPAGATGALFPAGGSRALIIGIVALIALLGLGGFALSQSGRSGAVSPTLPTVARAPNTQVALDGTASASFAITQATTGVRPVSATAVQATTPNTATIVVAATQILPTATPTLTATPSTRTPTYAPPTHTSTVTWTFTPTLTSTATVVPASPVLTAVHTAQSIAILPSTTPTETPASTIPPVTANKQWKPSIQSYNGVTMMLVPPGCFMMGSTTGDPDEKPVNKQCIGHPFWIDQYEVSQVQFATLGGKASEPPGFPGDNNPIESLTWAEARDYCVARGGRLPTEVEWEYAARGPDDLIYPWGNKFVAANVVYKGNSNGQTADVSSHPGGVSWVGAFNMAGNVWEWISSLYRPYPYDANDGREATTNAPGDLRVVRGGSWLYDAPIERNSARNALDPDGTYGDVGVRCVRDF